MAMVAKAKAAPAPAPPPRPVSAQVLLASGNAKKLAELAHIAHQLGMSATDAQTWAQGRTALPEVVEDGATFGDNARKKALAALAHARACGDAQVSVLADDSGLCVDRLDGAPGVASARYSDLVGDRDTVDAANRDKLLEQLTDPELRNRRAHFACHLVLAGPLAAGPGAGITDDGTPWRVFVGKCDGAILTEGRGEGGFGYDPLFLSDDLGKSFAEAGETEKHAVSHRGRAMAALATYLHLRSLTVTEDRPLFVRPIGLLTLADALKRTFGNELRYADQALEQALGHAPQLGSKERQAVAEMHWHALRRLDHLCLATLALRGGGKPREAPDPRSLDAKASGLVALLTLADLDAHGQPRDPAKKGDMSALDGLAERSPGLAGSWPATAGQCATALRAATYAARELPELHRNAMALGFTPAFVTAAEMELGPEHARLALRYLGQRAPLTLRANRTRTSAQRLATELLEDGIATVLVPQLPDALWCAHPARVTQTRAFIEGRVEIQDEGSQRIVAAVGARSGETIIDWCAGAGGKTLALAAAMRGEGRLIALDPHAERLAECKRRCERAGVKVDTRVIEKTARPLSDFGDIGDAVLVDAPCSSSGALRRNPELRWHLDADWLDRFPEQQVQILVRASHHVKRGGRLVYATCSLLRRENEDVISAFLASREEFDLVSESRIGPANGAWLATHPLPTFGPDGFFVAVLRRRPKPPQPAKDTDRLKAVPAR
ncbi:MAG: class I SAM-dependent methyltransferase [Deltaproteobacteria bacterium]|nr:class I SAM-dependent methyltransferase [Deltaproteobacteria bacterium]